MSDASEAFASPVVRKVGGQDVEFPRIVGREYGMLESALKAKLVAADEELLNDCQIVGKGRYTALRGRADEPVTLGHVNVALRTYEFARKALELSLKKAKHPSPAEVIDQMPSTDMSE